MDLVCSRDAFARAMRASTFGLTGRSASSILGGVRLSVAGGQLILETTDLDRAARCRLPLESSNGEEPCVLDGAVLERIASRLPEDQRIRLESGDSPSVMRLTCGETSFDLPTLSLDEFPDIGDLQGERVADLSGAEFHRGLELTAFAAFRPNETTRLPLTGIDLDVRGNTFRMMSCNGHRLAVRSTEIAETARDAEALVEAKTLADLDRAFAQLGEKTVELQRSEGQLFFHTGAASYMVRTIPDEFPSFERVIPQESRVSWTVDRQGLLDALQRIMITASEESGAVRFHGAPDDAAITLFSASRDRGESNERVSLRHVLSEPFDIAFRATYIVDVVRRLASPEIVFRIQSSDKACLIEPSGDRMSEKDLGFLYVCMPIHAA